MLKNMSTTISVWKEKLNVTVAKCRFLKNPKWPWLWCSPDEQLQT